ncbi:MAG: nitronate monooxygenase [Halioglobus sp.]
MHTSICDLLGCRVPIVLAGMGGPARAELVAAVTAAGGYGFLGMVRESPGRIAREIAAVREQTALPFGVNLIPAATDRALLDAELQACIDAKIASVTLFWDLAPDIIRRLRDAGITVLCQIGSAEEAEAARDAGADILIAQGCEAGGHVRGRTPARDLLPQVLAVADCPVLLSGGMTDGADLAWAITAGAAGVMMGTAFLATEESYAHAYHKQRIVDARIDDTRLTDVFHINWPRGARVRVLDNSVTRGAWGDPFDPANARTIARQGCMPISLFSTDSPLRTTEGELEPMALYAGEGSARIGRIARAGDLVREIAAQAQALLTATTAGAAAPLADEPASPVCYAGEVNPSYNGMASRDELIAALEELLQAERAGARVAGQSARDLAEGDTGKLLLDMQRDEAKWCAMLMEALRQLHAAPSRTVGAFHGKAMAIVDLDERLAFLNRGQEWVVRRLEKLIPRVPAEKLRQDLATMRRAHLDNISLIEGWLTRRRES